jgi:dTDP-4-dehydrorhamnose reductase
VNIVILGATGLIGHKLYQRLRLTGHTVSGFIHGRVADFPNVDFLQSGDIVEQTDVLAFDDLAAQIQERRADVVLNCVGITKRKSEVNDPLLAIGVNSLFPHKLVELSRSAGFRVIHFSTDCVFNGETGDYTEDSNTTGEDAYGKTKALGEIRYPESLTIRSSFIGRELAGKTELLEWLLAQEGNTIKGFTEAYYSGVSTLFMAEVVRDIIENYPDLSHLHQLATPEPISKYDLLCCARDAFGLDVEIVPDDSFKIKPTLNGGKLANAMKLTVPNWRSMMAELAADPTYSHL